MRNQRLWFVLAAALVLDRAQGATIQITYNFVPSEAQPAIGHAAAIWGSILVSDVPIKAMVTWVPMGASALGITFPNGRRDFPAAPVPMTWYASALANSIAGTELNPGENDFEIYLDSGTDWYFGTDGLTPAGQYDLVSVALHEMGHGLGFVGLSKKTDGVGSFGLLLQSDFAPLTTSFPWPQLDTLPGIFDRFLAHPQNGPLDLMDNPSGALGSAMTSNQVRFNGPLAMAANDGNAPRIHSPSTFALGSSCVHLNESTYPESDPNELMTPFSNAGSAHHWPGPLCLAMLQDIGWTLAPDVGIAMDLTMTTPLRVFPNPVDDELLVQSPAGALFKGMVIEDAMGRIVRASATVPMDVSDLAPGVYHLRVPLRQDFTAVRFVKN